MNACINADVSLVVVSTNEQSKPQYIECSQQAPVEQESHGELSFGSLPPITITAVTSNENIGHTVHQQYEDFIGDDATLTSNASTDQLQSLTSSLVSQNLDSTATVADLKKLMDKFTSSFKMS